MIVADIGAAHCVLMHRPYDVYSRLEMEIWCHEHCAKPYHRGSPGREGYKGHELCFEQTPEVPWRFESEEDAMMFALRWL